MATAAILLTTLATGLFGIGRGLWLDEAWVANAALLPSIGDSLWGGEWLQTSPLGFVLAARLAPESIVGFRVVPLIFALLAAVLLLAATRRVLSEPLAVLATAAVLFDPIAIEHLRSFKQFGAELAAVAAILWAVSSSRPWAPLAAIPFAYTSLIVMAGFLTTLTRRQAMALGALAAAEAGLLYWFVIRPNTSPILWDYWRTAPSLPLALLFCAAIAGLLLARRNAMAVVCLSAVALASLAALAGWYPASPRTWLFLRPCLVLPIAMLLDRFVPLQRLAYAAALAVLVNGAAGQILDRTDQPFENYPALIAALQPRLQPGDLLLVHANAREGFRLHTLLAGWNAPAKYGSTGWPCCRRNENTPRGGADSEAVQRDLDRLIPRDFTGRVWLVFANRDLHWNYIGLDEGKVWRNTLWERGCPPGPYMDFGNLVLSPMNCTSNSP